MRILSKTDSTPTRTRRIEFWRALYNENEIQLKDHEMRRQQKQCVVLLDTKSSRQQKRGQVTGFGGYDRLRERR